MQRFENEELNQQYEQAAQKVGEMFNAWFDKAEVA